jgi:hypothetical protein
MICKKTPRTATAIDNVYDAGREASLDEQFAPSENAQRRLLRAFVDELQVKGRQICESFDASFD